SDFVRLFAEVRLAEGRFEEAQTMLSQAVEKQPNDARLKLLYADALARGQNLPKARETLQSMTQSLPADTPLVVDAIDKKIDLGMTAEAAQDATRYAKNPAYRIMHDYLNGRIQAQLGQWTTAIPLLKAAVPNLAKLPPVQLKAYLSLGECYRRANDPDAMLASFRSASRIDGDDPMARLGQADAYVMLNQYAAAINLYKRLAESRPEARIAMTQAAFRLQMARPESKRTWAEFDQLVGAAPYPTPMLVVMADSLVARKLPAKAEQLLRDAIAKQSDSVELVGALALLIAHTDTTEAQSLLDTIPGNKRDTAAFRLAQFRLATNTTNPQPDSLRPLTENLSGFKKAEQIRLLEEFGQLYAGPLKLPLEARRVFEQLVQIDPQHLGARVALYELAVQEKNPDAIARAQTALKELEGEDGPTKVVMDTLRSLASLKDPSEIARRRTQLEQITKLRPNWGQAFALLGALDQLANEPAAAATHYRKAFDLGERPEPLVRGLVQIQLQQSRPEEARRILETYSQSNELPRDLQDQLALLDVVVLKDPRKATVSATALQNSEDASRQLFRG
ncbi:MAG: tetratricopeptide repeat protein, partial [Gemmataceae bacterium]